MNPEDVTDADWRAKVAEDPSRPLLIVFHSAQSDMCVQAKTWLQTVDIAGLRCACIDIDVSTDAKETLGVLSVPNWIVVAGDLDMRAGYIGPWSDAPVPGASPRTKPLGKDDDPRLVFLNDPFGAKASDDHGAPAQTARDSQGRY